jgi:hypothetical protein
MNMSDLKWCSYCKQSHPRSEFSKTWRTRDGLNGWCKKAHRAYRNAKKNAVDVVESVQRESSSALSASLRTASCGQ